MANNTPYTPDINSDSADFVPSMGDYKTLQPFRYWCQKVLPLAYDDSLSYYELLCKVVDYLNKTMEDVETLHGDVDDLHTAYAELQGFTNTSIADLRTDYQNLVNYVNNYFSTLDVQQEINNKLDAMALNGSLTALLSPYVPNAVSVWLTEHITPTTPVVDNTLTISGAAADAKITGDDINNLKNALNLDALYGNLLGYGTTSYGKTILASTGGETANADFDTTDFIPVSEGELLYSNIITRYAFYDSEKALVSTSNFSSRQLLFSEVSNVRYAVVPTGASYFRISYRKDLANSCFVCRPNVYDIVYGQKIEEIVKNAITTKTNFWDYGTVLDNKSISALSGNTMNDANYKTTDFIPVTPGTAIYGYGARFYCYDENKTAISDATGVLNTNGKALSNGMHYYKIPEGAAFFRICAIKTITEPNQFQIYSTDIFETILHPMNTRKLYTLGDSITRGMYAEKGATSSSGPTPQGYPYWIGQIAGYDVVNLGNSGSGWANVGSAETAGDPSTARNAKDVVDDNTFTDADIITMAWGVNDWKGATQNVVLGDMSSVSGDGTVIGNMKYCIETLADPVNGKAKQAQIIILLPLNTNRQWTGMETMTLANNWAFGYAYRNGQTLEDYRDAIKECAEYYNLKVIDLEEVCPINRLNIRQVLGDGLHPTKAFYKQMGLALASLIN